MSLPWRRNSMPPPVLRFWHSGVSVLADAKKMLSFADGFCVSTVIVVSALVKEWQEAVELIVATGCRRIRARRSRVQVGSGGFVALSPIPPTEV